MKVVGYTRVSTKKQDPSEEPGVPIPAQKRYLETWCKREKWNLDKIFTDTKSAKDMNRPELKAMLKYTRDNKINAIVVIHNDRLTRSVGDLCKILDYLRKHKIQLQCGNLQGIDLTTPAGEMLLINVGSIAQYTRKDLGVKTSIGMQEKKSQGLNIGRPPFGFIRDPNDKGKLILKDRRVLAVFILKDRGDKPKNISLELDIPQKTVTRLISSRKRLIPYLV